MGRAQRLTYRGALHHVTMRCNNKEFLFEGRSFVLFLDVLREACDRFKARLFNYSLMTNHVHLLFNVPADDVLPKLMHRVANLFSKRFNAMRQRKGHLWEGRYLSTIVEAPSYFLRCMAYIDLNPVRARMVADPADYRWSPHRAILAEDQATISLHRIYLELGKDQDSRRRAYSAVVRAEADRAPCSLARMLFVGSREFVSRMEKRFAMSDPFPLPRTELIDIGDGARALTLRKPHRPTESDGPA